MYKLRKAEIIPTGKYPHYVHSERTVAMVTNSSPVIDDFLPSLTLSVYWSKDEAGLGNTIKPKHLQSQPSITLHDDTSPKTVKNTGLTYVITLTDPDAPSRENPEWSEMCHWIATNVSVATKTFSILPLPEFGLTEETIEEQSNPDDIIEYKPPGPPPKTGRHRYVFLVFAPKNGTTEPLHLSKPKDRQHWGTGEEGGGVRDWAEKNGLVPVAANFIQSKNKEQ
ncbi:hypothetical protein N0V94_003886 [Neodidymelliopsis sp. IMI 364377]|nr:hypothetical protein N0V94_003886 [Neodidymelliopsis sp. IMI 364377]